VGAVLVAGCRSTPTPHHSEPVSEKSKSGNQTNAVPLESQCHSLVVTPSARDRHIPIYHKLNPFWWFMNVDDPNPPAWFSPDSNCRRVKWFLRNPFHNFGFYVIGIADHEFVRSGGYPGLNSDPDGGWNFAVSKYKWRRLPYASYWRGRFEFYIGWRNRGNFGIKISFSREKESEKVDLPHAKSAKDAK
jgi:hypothetical protein